MTLGRLLRRAILAVVLVIAALSVYTLYAESNVRARYPPTGEFMTIPPGTQVHFTDTGGAGAPVVLLHGNPGSVRDFDKVTAALQDGHRVLAIDRPGHGYSDRPAAATPRDQAAWLFHVMTRLGTPPPVMVGHSWGGALALIYAIENPWEVAGLVLVGTRGVAGTDHGSAIYSMSRTPVVGAFLRWTVLIPIGRGLVANGLREAYSPDPVPPEEISAAQALWLRPGQSEATVWDTANLQSALASYLSRLDKVRVPVTIVVGDRDSLLAESRELHRLMPNSTLRVVPGAGHMLPKTRPDIIAEAVRELEAARTAKQ